MDESLEQDGQQPPLIAGQETQDSGQLETFNFTRGGQISAEQMKAITTVNDLFARNLTDTLGASLRTKFLVSLAFGKQIGYAEYLAGMQDPTFVCSLRLEPLGSIGLLEVDLSLVAPVVDLLLGGVGKAQTARQLTEIEELLIASVVETILKELNVAWTQVGLRFALEKREPAAQLARLMAAGEKTLCVSFEVKMPDAQGVMNLCVPAVVLNTILRQVHGLQASKPRPSPPEVRMRVKELVGEVSVGALLQFPTVRLKAREIAALVEGSVLRLPLPRHSAAELRVGGLVFGKARPVRTGEHRGARMEPKDLLSTEDAGLHAVN